MSEYSDLDKFIVENGPERIYYIPDFISKEEEGYLKDCVNKAPKPRWTQLQNRRLQNWGGVPHPKGMIAEKLPPWLNNIVGKVSDLGVFGEKKPSHVLVNEYLSGQGIMPHLDGPLFYPTITTVNLGSHGVLNFYKPINEDNPKDNDPSNSSVGDSSKTSDLSSRQEFSLLLEPRSLLILQQVCYHHYLHGISETTSDTITPQIINLAKITENLKINDEIPRSTRISLTIRHVPKTTKPILRLGN